MSLGCCSAAWSVGSIGPSPDTISPDTISLTPFPPKRLTGASRSASPEPFKNVEACHKWLHLRPSRSSFGREITIDRPPAEPWLSMSACPMLRGGNMVSGTCEKISFTDFSTTHFQYFAQLITGPNSIFSHVPGTISRSQSPAQRRTNRPRGFVGLPETRCRANSTSSSVGVWSPRMPELQN